MAEYLDNDAAMDSSKGRIKKAMCAAQMDAGRSHRNAFDGKLCFILYSKLTNPIGSPVWQPVGRLFSSNYPIP